MDAKKVKSQKFELLNFSDEILLQILTNSSDIDLLNATRVCKQFKSIAKDTYVKRYDGESADKYYEITVDRGDSEQVPKLHIQFLRTFGNEITAINIKANGRYIWKKLIKLIEKQCNSIKYLIVSNNGYGFPLTKLIRSMSALTILTVKSLYCKNFIWTGIKFPHLKCLTIEKIFNLDIAHIETFLQMNPQLQKLCVLNCNNYSLSMIQLLKDNFPKLKSIEFIASENDIVDNCPDIEMQQLESLAISVGETSYQKILLAIGRGSKMIQQLEVFWHDRNGASIIHHSFCEPFPLFERLTSLHLHKFDLTRNVILDLVRNLPKLITLKLDGLRLNDLSPHDVLSIFTTCKHITELLWEASGDGNCIDVNKFNLEFHRKFSDITLSRGSVKFELIQHEMHMTITDKKITKNGELFHWTGYKASNSSSKVNFLDLTEECMEKICFYLDEESERALYETCKRTKKVIQHRIMEQEFAISNANNAKDTLSRFGEHIAKLSIDMQTNDRVQMTETWKLVNEYCKENLNELSFKNIRVNAMASIKPEFPNLTKLTVISMISNCVHIFPPMKCPKLTHLEFHKGNITLSAIARIIGISFNHLTTIWLKYFSKSIEKIIHSLNDETCDKLQKFTVEKSEETQLAYEKFLSIAMRFKNLTKLHLTIKNVQTANTKYLFMICTKLVELSLGYDHSSELDDWRKMIRYIKENCKQLRVFQLIRDSDSPFEQKVLLEIVYSLPNVTLNLITYVEELESYRVERFRNVKDSDHKKPY